MRNLLWKEWHEQAWQLAFGCVVLSAMAAIGLHARMVPDATMVEWACLISVTLLPVLASTGLVPAERAEGSFESLLALPVRPWRILAAKTVLGAALCVGPTGVAAVVSVTMAGGREMLSGQMLDLYCRSALSSVALLVWMMVLTIRLPSEARAALLAVGALILWVLASAALALAMQAVGPIAFVASPFAFVSPFLGSGDAYPGMVVSLLVQSAILAGAWLLALRVLAKPVEEVS